MLEKLSKAEDDAAAYPLAAMLYKRLMVSKDLDAKIKGQLAERALSTRVNHVQVAESFKKQCAAFVRAGLVDKQMAEDLQKLVDSRLTNKK